MFRYIALCWDHRDGGADAAATRCCMSVRRQPSWSCVFASDGLQVYMTGARAGQNGALPLPGGRGIVLGRVFRRLDPDADAVAPQVVSVSGAEAAALAQGHGAGLTDRLWGRYVAFLCCEDGPRVLRDPTGALPCHRVTHQGADVVFSWLEDALALLPDLPAPTVDLQAVAVHLGHGRSSGPATGLTGVTRVLPGESAPIGPGPGRRASLAWDAGTFAREARRSDPHGLPARLRRTTRACVQAWASDGGPVLLRLSGGLDSSIVLSCLTPDDTTAPVTCVNHRSAGTDGDERAFARLAAAHAHRTLIERERDAGEPLETILGVALTPDPGGLVGRLGSGRLDAALAGAVGAHRVFTGAGGDQLFFALPCCWPLADHLHTRGVDSDLWRVALDTARLGRVSVWAAIGAALRERVRPGDPWPPARRPPALLCRDAWVAAPPRDRYLHPALALGHGLPVGKASQLMQLLQPIDYYDPLLRDAAPEVVHPLLSQPLVELCLATPIADLVRGGQGRALAREAFRGDLPDRIRGRRSKGGMGDHLARLLANNRDTARSLLLDGELARHGLLDRRTTAQRLAGQVPVADAARFELIQCLGVEAWMRRACAHDPQVPHRPARGPGGA